MSTLSELDGGDLERTLQKHRLRKQWLKDAEAWMSSKDVVCLTSWDPLQFDGPRFSFNIQRAIWAPQLREQMDECRKQVDELDRIVRTYMEAALKL